MSKVIKPLALRSRPTVGFFSPSEPLTEQRMTRLHANAKNLPSDIEVHWSTNIAAKEMYMAGSVNDRISDIEGLLDQGCDVIWATWGGKASLQLVEAFPYERLAAMRTIVLGFSDNATFLNALTATTGLISFYGPNVAGKMDESAFSDLRTLRQAADWTGNPFDPQDEHDCEVLRPGVGSGLLLGGNLSSFAAVYPFIARRVSSAQTKFVFFWESGSARAPEIDQTLTSLRLQGFFKHVSAMVVGTLGSGDYETATSNATNTASILRPLDGLEIPIVSIPLFGHSDLLNPPIPIGGSISVDTASTRCRVEMQEDPIDRSPTAPNRD